MTDTGTFTTRYEQMTDDELLRVAAERETLVADAVIAIDTELARRGFSVATAKEETKRAERKETRRAIGHLGLSSRGWGKHFFGVSNYRLDLSSDTEEFDSTIWLWIMWLPTLPLASYHIQRHKLRKSLWWSFGKQPFSASNEAPPYLLHVVTGLAFAVLTALVAYRLLVILLGALVR